MVVVRVRVLGQRFAAGVAGVVFVIIGAGFGLRVGDAAGAGAGVGGRAAVRQPCAPKVLEGVDLAAADGAGGGGRAGGLRPGVSAVVTLVPVGGEGQVAGDFVVCVIPLGFAVVPAIEDVARAGGGLDLVGDRPILEEIAHRVVHRAVCRGEGDFVVGAATRTRLVFNDAQGAIHVPKLCIRVSVSYQPVVCAAGERAGIFHRAVECAVLDLAVVGHSAVELGGVCAAALDDACVGGAVVVFRIKHDCAVYRTAIGLHLTVQAEGAAVGGLAALDRAAGHGEYAVLVAHVHSAAFVASLAAFDNAARQLERAYKQVHTAAFAASLAARDAAGVHGELSTGYDAHSAAVAGLTAHDIAAVHDGFATAAANTYGAVAAGDDAALDNLVAVGFIPHPQAVVVGGEFVLRSGVAVHDGQSPCAIASDMNRILPQVEDVAVEVEGELAVIPDYHRPI